MVQNVKIENEKPKICKKCGQERNSFPLGTNGSGKYYYRPTCTICKNATDKRHRIAYYHRTKEIHREKYHRTQRKHRLKKKYGLTPERYDEMLENQNNACAICKTPKPITNMPVDHNHATGKIRGILCSACNKALGHFKDDITTMQNAIIYIRNDGF